MNDQKVLSFLLIVYFFLIFLSIKYLLGALHGKLLSPGYQQKWFLIYISDLGRFVLSQGTHAFVTGIIIGGLTSLIALILFQGLLHRFGSTLLTILLVFTIIGIIFGSARVKAEEEFMDSVIYPSYSYKKTKKWVGYYTGKFLKFW